MSVREYFNWTLVFFVAAFLVLPNSKMVNNFYYVFFAIPGLFFLLRNYKLLKPINLPELAFIVLSLFIASYGFLEQQKTIIHALYVVVFVYGVSRFVEADFFDSRLFARLLFWGGMLYAAACIISSYVIGDNSFGMRLNPGVSRLYSPIQISMFIACSLFIIGPHWLKGKSYLEGFTGLLLAFLVIALVFQSRTGIVAMALWGIFILVYLIRSYGTKGLVALAVALLLLILISIPVFELAGQTTGLIERADAHRFSIWRGYLLAWQDCGVIFGCGFPDVPSQHLVLEPNGENVYVTHNIVINLFYHFGVISVVIFSIMMLSILTLAWQQKNWWGGYLSAGVLTLMLDGNRIINNPDIVWLMIWLPMALILAREWEKQKQKESQ